MNSITFRNFRKFKDETTFELNNINILVGPNNSGKSTLTKGLRLYLYNILNLQVSKDNIFSIRPFFQFGGDVFDNPHIGTFGRALSKDAKEDVIYFSAKFCNTFIETWVSRYSIHSKDAEGNLIDYFNATSAPITKICIHNADLDAAYYFDFEKGEYTIVFNAIGKPDYYDMWQKRIEDVKGQIEKKKNVLIDGEYTENEYLIHRLENCLSFGSREKIIMQAKLLPFMINGKLIDSLDGKLYHSLIKYVFRYLVDSEKNEYIVDKSIEHYLDEEHFGEYFTQINFDILDDFHKYVEGNIPVVIEAHSVTHSLVYNISDKNDYMAQTILNYVSQDIKDADPEKIFIEKWMAKFKLGEDFIIENFGGECFKCEIIEDVDHPENRTPLLDKGVGSNQIMILLLRLATIMRQNRGATIPCTIIIEEPEQNLHPKLQSLLADLFYEVYQYPQTTNKDSWGISFLVETHSEYLVRKSQIITAKHPVDEDNPFTVYYLGEWDSPKQMIYQENGTFANDFGEGFYDESIRLTEEIV